MADGSKKATIKLMIAHATGDGIPKDLDKAKDLYELAKKKWPKAAEKALADLPEEQRTALLPPPPAPVAHTPTSTSTPKRTAYQWKYESCAAQYYLNASQSSCEEDYSYGLISTNNLLQKIVNDFGGSMTVLRIHLALKEFLATECYRITLMSKYGVTAAQLNSKYGALISKQVQLTATLFQLLEQNPDYTNYAICSNILIIMMDASADVNGPRGLYKKAVSQSCENFLTLTYVGLSEVKSSADLKKADAALSYYIGYQLLVRYIQMTLPELEYLTESDLYSDGVQKILIERDRIIKAGCYGSDSITTCVESIR